MSKSEAEAKPESEAELEQVAAPKPKRWSLSKLGIAGSLLLSLSLLGWAFTLPFQGLPTSPLEAARPEGPQTGPTKESRAEAIRHAAFANHREFLKTLPIRKASVAGEKRGAEDVRRYLAERAERIESELKSLGQPEQGTLQWHRQQMLMQSLQDNPR